jgi:hypothetical protein
MKSTQAKKGLPVQSIGQVIPLKTRTKAFVRKSLQQADAQESRNASIVCLTGKMQLLKEIGSWGILHQVITRIGSELDELMQAWSDVVGDRIRLLDNELDYQLDRLDALWLKIPRTNTTDVDVCKIEEHIVSLIEIQKAYRIQFREWQSEMRKGTKGGLAILFDLERKQFSQQVALVKLRTEMERYLQEPSTSENNLLSYAQHTNRFSNELVQMARLQCLLITEMTLLRDFLTSIAAVEDRKDIKLFLLNLDERYLPLLISGEGRSERVSLIEIRAQQEAWQPSRREILLRHQLRLQRIATAKSAR